MAETGSITDALAHGRRLLARDPHKAAEQAHAILAVAPHLAQAKLLLAAALRRQGQADAALTLLDGLAMTQPRAPLVWLELGMVLADQGAAGKAVAALGRATALNPDLGEAWGVLVVLHTLAGDDAAAAAATLQQLRVANPSLHSATAALLQSDDAAAEQGLRAILQTEPDHVPALRLLAETLIRQERYAAADRTLRHCLTLAPRFALARFAHAMLLRRMGDDAAALQQAQRLLRDEPADRGWRDLQDMLEKTAVPLGGKAR